MENEILFSTHKNGIAEVTLNRPRAINSLTYKMLKPFKEKLKEWEKNSDIKLVVLTGAGEKGFCAGGDMKTLYEAGQKGEALEKGRQFFELEYEVDQLVDEFTKPIIAVLDGIVMGGGVGLAYGASHRIVTERTKWAMPEMNIGFFPDVGAAYFLNKTPGYIGRYLALTSSVINGAESIYINAADHFMDSNDLEKFLNEVKNIHWHESSVDQVLGKLVDKYVMQPSEKEKVRDYEDEINQHFKFESMKDIGMSLQKGESEFSADTAKIILSKSPVSLKVTLKQLVDGKGKTFAEALATDLVIARNFMTHADFFEGVRSVLVDKDNSPQYKYKKLSDVSDSLVDHFFE